MTAEFLSKIDTWVWIVGLVILINFIVYTVALIINFLARQNLKQANKCYLSKKMGKAFNKIGVKNDEK